MAKRNNRSNSRNDKRRVTRGKGKVDTNNTSRDCDVNDRPSVSDNDASWYAMSPEMLNAASSFSYNTPLGGKMDFGSGYSTNHYVPKPFAFPGVMAIETVNMPGFSDNGASPLNIAAKNIYSFVRHANSGSNKYDAPDLMLYLLAVDSLYSYHAFLTRLYGVMTTYSQVNRYYPKALVEAMGVDFDDIIQHGIDLNYYIELLAKQIGSLCYPAEMKYTVRHAWMYSNVYADGISQKSGSYIFVPVGFHQYQNTTLQTGGTVVFSPWLYNTSNVRQKHTFADIVQYGSNLVNTIVPDEDCQIMSGDILKAYGADGVLKIGPVPIDYTVMPVFNPEVLTQINNATVLGWEGVKNNLTVQVGDQSIDSFSIYQENNTLYCKPSISTGAAPNSNLVAGQAFRQIINMPIDNVTPADTMVATRLKSFVTPFWSTDQVDHYDITVFGSEIVLRATMLVIDYGSGGNSFGYEYIRYGNEINEGNWADIDMMCDATNFGMFPIMLSYHEDTTNLSHLNVLNNISNFTMIDYQELSRMNETAMMSLFTVPQFASARKYTG